MSIRNALKQSINDTQEKCCTVALPRERNNATNDLKQATMPATNHATQSPKASNFNVFDATSNATTVQQALKRHATNGKLSVVADKESIEIKMIQAWLTRIEEPSEDHHLVLDKCKSDSEALEYFLKHARGGFKGGTML